MRGFHIAHDGVLDHVDLHPQIFRAAILVIVYGQTELTRDLYAARDRLGGKGDAQLTARRHVA